MPNVRFYQMGGLYLCKLGKKVRKKYSLGKYTLENLILKAVGQIISWAFSHNIFSYNSF